MAWWVLVPCLVAMDAPDEMVEAVAEAIADADTENDTAEFWKLYRDQARAVLSVPALAEVIARDAKVRERVLEMLDEAREQVATSALDGTTGAFWRGRASALATIAAEYPEPVGPDDSDIMPDATGAALGTHLADFLDAHQPHTIATARVTVYREDNDQ